VQSGNFTVANNTIVFDWSPTSNNTCNWIQHIGVGVLNVPADGSIVAAKMAANSVDSDSYVDGSIDAVHLSANSVDSDAYVDASIDNAHLADDAVGVAELSATGTASSSTFLRGDNAWASAGGGKIGQVLQATKTDTQQMSGTTSVTAITGLSVAITPAATSSKILCMYTIQSASTDNSVVFLLQRGGTTIIQGAAASSRARGTTAGARIGHDGTNDPQNTSSFQYLDSPSSTSELTYTVAMQDNDAGEVDINRSMSDADSASRSRTASQLTCMEVLV
jgi:hypothetical protein